MLHIVQELSRTGYGNLDSRLRSITLCVIYVAAATAFALILRFDTCGTTRTVHRPSYVERAFGFTLYSMLKMICEQS